MTMTTTQQPTQKTIDEFVGSAHGDFARVRDLLAQYPDLINTNASWVETPIEAAAQMGREDIMTLLLDHGAPLEICTAAALGQADTVAAMLAADPDLAHATGAHDIPVLYFPVIGGHQVIAEQLLAAGANVNAGAGGTTPLHGAALFGRPALAAWLLDHGADPNPPNYENKTPLQVAVARGQHEVAAVLRARGGTE
jgi:ankyrin repeat protein